MKHLNQNAFNFALNSERGNWIFSKTFNGFCKKMPVTKHFGYLRLI